MTRALLQAAVAVTTPTNWALVSAAVAMAGLVWAILRAGATAVSSSASVAASVTDLTETVKRIDMRVEGYIHGEDVRDQGMESWRRTVDSRLSGIEATLSSLTARTGRRRTDPR